MIKKWNLFLIIEEDNHSSLKVHSIRSNFNYLDQTELSLHLDFS